MVMMEEGAIPIKPAPKLIPLTSLKKKKPAAINIATNTTTAISNILSTGSQQQQPPPSQTTVNGTHTTTTDFNIPTPPILSHTPITNETKSKTIATVVLDTEQNGPSPMETEPIISNTSKNTTTTTTTTSSIKPRTPRSINKNITTVTSSEAFFDKDSFKIKLQVVNPESFTEEEIQEINSDSIASEIYTNPTTIGDKLQLQQQQLERQQKQQQHQHTHQDNYSKINSLEDEKRYTQRYRYLKRNEEILNKPVYKEIEDDHPTAPFNKPSGYIIYQEKSNETLHDEIEYDMDSEDEQFLDEFNSKSSIKYTDDDLEFIINRLEKETFKYKQEIGSDMFPHFSSVQAEDVCGVCFDGTSDDTNQIVYCDGCDIAVHQDCYGILLIPEGHWFCQKCESPDKDSISCALCGKKSGTLKQTLDGDWVHLVCAYNIPELTQVIKKGSGREKLGPVGLLGNVLKQRYKLKCTICKKKIGACIQCRERNCSTAFHPYCIKMKQKPLIDENPNPHVILCDKHFHHHININNNNSNNKDLEDDDNKDEEMDDDDDDYEEEEESDNESEEEIKTPSKKTYSRSRPSKRPPRSNNNKKLKAIYNDDEEEEEMEIDNKKKTNKKKTTTTTTTTTSSTPIPKTPTMTGITAKKAGLISVSRAVKSLRSFQTPIIHAVYEYWVKKRISRSGLALIKRFQPSILFSLRSTLHAQESGVNTVSDYNKMVSIREDLERTRTILELIKKRERQKRELIINIRDQIESTLLNDYHFLRLVLKSLETIDSLRPFYYPVSEEEAPSYFSIIKQPMSFQQIKQSLNTYAYDDINDFWKDLTLIYTNAQLFNRPKTVVYKASQLLQEITHKLESDCPNEITSQDLDTFIKNISIVKPSNINNINKVNPDSISTSTRTVKLRTPSRNTTTTTTTAINNKNNDNANDDTDNLQEKRTTKGLPPQPSPKTRSASFPIPITPIKTTKPIIPTPTKTITPKPSPKKQPITPTSSPLKKLTPIKTTTTLSPTSKQKRIRATRNLAVDEKEKDDEQQEEEEQEEENEKDEQVIKPKKTIMGSLLRDTIDVFKPYLIPSNSPNIPIRTRQRNSIAQIKIQPLDEEEEEQEELEEDGEEEPEESGNGEDENGEEDEENGEEDENEGEDRKGEEEGQIRISNSVKRKFQKKQIPVEEDFKRSLTSQQKEFLVIVKQISAIEEKGGYFDHTNKAVSTKENIKWIEHIYLRIFKGSYDGNWDKFWGDIDKIVNRCKGVTHIKTQSIAKAKVDQLKLKYKNRIKK